MKHMLTPFFAILLLIGFGNIKAEVPNPYHFQDETVEKDTTEKEDEKKKDLPLKSRTNSKIHYR